MASDQYYLVKDRRFLPLFVTQFCGAFNDSAMKNALIILVTFKASIASDLKLDSLILLANALYIFPFIIFAGIAGQIADKYPKYTIVKIIKFLEVLIVLNSVYGLYTGSLITLFTSLGLMGVHSTFFGPIKYSILPEYLRKNELLSANGYLEASTFLAILIGGLMGGFVVLTSNSGIMLGLYFVSFLMIMISVIGFLSSLYLAKSEVYNSEIKINYNIFAETWNMVKYSCEKKHLFLSILGISWFWFIGSAILAQIPILVKNNFAADQNVANLFLTVFSIGVGVGSFWCNRLLDNEITTKYVFIACLGMAIFGIDMFFASRIATYKHQIEDLRGIVGFLFKEGKFYRPTLHNWRIIFDLFFLSVLGGLYIVPLYSAMQYFSNPNYRSRIISANNVINAIFMIAAAILLNVLFGLGFSIPSVILVISLLNAVVAFYIYNLLNENVILPRSFITWVLKLIIERFYTIEVKGYENFVKSGKKTVVVANHTSYLDPPLLSIYLSSDINFAIHTNVAESWWIKPILSLVKTYKIDTSNPMSLKSLITDLKNGKTIGIFPEGRITLTGSLMKIYEGPGMIADKADANILPVRIDGPQYTHFSKLKNFDKRRIFTKITITILPPIKLNSDELDAKKRRQKITEELYDVMSDMMFESSNYKKTLFESLIFTASNLGYNKEILQDIDNSGLTYRQLILKSFILGDLISELTEKREYVGLMLPNSCGATITFFALQAFARVPTMINFTSGASNIINGCKTALVTKILTSRKFIEKADLYSLVEKLEESLEIVYLEDLRDKITFSKKIKGLVSSYLPIDFYEVNSDKIKSTDPAVILFTSGTEGTPKAVVLSHENIHANIYQVVARVEISNNDFVFNALPMFHCFGLTAGTLLSVISGVKSFQYPSPLHYRIIPELIYDVSATITFSTDTFLNGYAKFAHPYDFYSVRYIFAGAEKIKEETTKLWFEKFGVRIFEGYGVTESSPVVAVNTPMHYKLGTVGRPLPKMKYAVLPVEGIDNGGRLCVSGPNIMMGYIKSDNPGKIVKPYVENLGEGWYDTGDIVSVDDQKFIKILGRAKRFAKIAGEMVSLSAIEELVNKIDSEKNNAAVIIQDDLRGEQILLFTESQKVNRDSVLEMIKAKLMPEIMLPKYYITIEEIPVLGTGKTDYITLSKMAKEYAEKKEDN